jgi:NTE family protein
MTGRGHAPLRAAAVLGSLVVAALVAGPLAAQPAQRPRIGIAFSGGGAKGCAHIGVLRVLEELRVPVDYAAGASMGAIVGGLYASGLDPDQLTEAILTVDWADALTDEPARKDLVFRRKNDDLRYIPDLELGIGRGGIRFPTGLRSGQKLNYLLRTFTLPVRTVRDFDELPIPFRAVATDIATGEMVVLDHGDLGRAMRASMAIPTVFSAVEMEGRLLVDGGVSDNVPVDVVRAMGADVVIAIDIGSPLLGEEKVGRSYLSILSQTLGMITRANMTPRLAAADLVITPDVASFGTLEFSAGPEIIARGEAEARKLAEELAPYALSEAEYGAWRAARRREPDPIPQVTSVRIEGNQRVDARILAAQVRLEPGAPFSPERARDDLARIFGLGDFETVDVELEPEGDGAAVVYRVREKSWGPTYLRAGVGFEATGEGDNNLALAGSVNRTRINPLGAEWKTEVELGSDAIASTRFYQPLSFTRGWFVEPFFSYRRRSVPLFDGGEQVAELDVRAEDLRADLGYEFGRYGEVRLGLRRSWITPRLDSGVLPEGTEVALGENYDLAGVSLLAAVDRLDSATLPKQGFLVLLSALQSFEALGAEADYAKLELKASRYWTRGRHTLFGNLNGGASPGGELPVYDQFVLGGFFSLATFEPGELRGDNYGLARVGYYYRLTRILHAGGYFEAARVAPVPEELLDNPILTATGLLAADTALGPFYLGASTAEGGRQGFFLVWGRQF